MGLTRLLKATTRRTAKVALYLAGLVAAVLATIVVVFAVQARLVANLPKLKATLWAKYVMLWTDAGGTRHKAGFRAEAEVSLSDLAKLPI